MNGAYSITKKIEAIFDFRAGCIPLQCGREGYTSFPCLLGVSIFPVSSVDV